MSTEMKYAVKFAGPRLGYGSVVLENPEIQGIPEGVCAVLGPNGAGKTTLGLVLEKGRYAYGNRLEFPKPSMKVRMLTFTDIHSLTGIDVHRHDQRLEATENELVPTVAEIVGESANDPRRLQLCDAFGLHDVMDKRVNFLSSGELRKLLIINALMLSPDMLVLDNPYIGLDAASRSELDAAIRDIASQGVSVVLLLCDAIDIPDYAGSVIRIDNRRLTALITDRKEIDAIRSESTVAEDEDSLELPSHNAINQPPYDTAFSITDGHLRYGRRNILEGLDWTVRSGERWALTGPNGSGKSLLLSLVCADNPQAYANNITIFDRRRGSGESIWEIKDRIGYVNPEMQLYFRSPLPVEEIVAQGMRNSLTRFRKPSPEELDEARTWLRLLDIAHLADRQYSELSSGEQRLVLLAAAIIKQPPLLILDEPLHGLDSRRKERVRRIVDTLVTRNGSSLIFVTHYTLEIPSCVTLTKTLKNCKSAPYRTQGYRNSEIT